MGPGFPCRRRHAGPPARAVVIAWLLLAILPSAAGADLGVGAVAVDRDGRTAWLAAQAAGEVVQLDRDTGRVVRRLALGAAPGGLALSRDGALLLATAGQVDGELVLIATADLRILARIPVGHTPVGVAVDASAGTAWVCDQFSDAVVEVDLGNRTVRSRIPVPRQPVSCALTPDGRTLAVANLLPAGRADIEPVASAVSVIDLASRRITDVPLMDGASLLRGVAIAPDGRHAYATHGLGRYAMPVTQLDRGWLVTNAVSIIALDPARLVATVLLDEAAQGAANPWAVAVSPAGDRLAVTSAGTHEVHLIDLPELHRRIAARLDQPTPALVETAIRRLARDMAALHGIRRRIPLDGHGPRAVAWASGDLLCTFFFSDRIQIVDGAGRSSATRAVAAVAAADQAARARRLGERFFHDASACFQQWLSCASCHPDGRSDGLNWDLSADGFGNGKQTKSLVDAHRYPPALLSGRVPTAEADIRSAFIHIQFAELPEDRAQAIETWMTSLQPVPSPHLRDGRLSAAAGRGRVLFDRAGCMACHSPGHRGQAASDRRSHDVGTALPRDAGMAYDTPTLAETWRNGPWLVDGRAATIHEVLRSFNAGDRHGATAGLGDADIDDLAAFILSQ